MRRGLPALLAGVAFLALTVGAVGVSATSPGEGLPLAFCSPVVAGGAKTPNYLIVSDLAEENRSAAVAQMTGAIKFILAEHDFRAGRYSVGYQSCDDSTPQTPQGDLAKCAANAKEYSAYKRVIGVIGAWNSACSGVEIPILGGSPTGPLMLLSPNNTYPGLTHASGGSAPGEPRRYFPSGSRNYVRLLAPDDFQGVAAAELARRLGLRRVFVIDDAEPYGLDVAGGFKTAAHNLHLGVVGSASWQVSQTNFDDLANRVALAHPDGVLLGGFVCPGCPSLIKALRKDLPAAKLIAPDGFLPVGPLVKAAGASVEGMYLTEPGLPSSYLGPVGRRLAGKFGATAPQIGGAPIAGQAVEVLLDAIARSDGTRSSVTSRVMGDSVSGEIIGKFSFDKNGDITPSAVTVYRAHNGRQVTDTVIRVPARLAQ